jgi:hypothetical protein
MVEVKSNEPSTVVMGTQVISVHQAPEKFMRDRRYIGILNHFVQDCRLSAEKSTYTEMDLTNLVNNYNKCKGGIISELPKKPAFRVDVKLFAGGLTSNLRVTGLPKNAFSPSRTAFMGGGLDISSPRSFDRSFLSLEVLYSEIFYQGYTEGTYRGNLQRKDILINLSYFKIPIGFKYNFGQNNNSPYLKAGLAFYVKQKTRIHTYDEQQSPNGIIYSDQYDGGYSIRTPKSIWLGVGYEKKIIGKYGMFAEMRVEQNNGFIGSIFTGYSSAIEANLIVGFRF